MAVKPWAKAQQGYPHPDYDRFGGWKKLHFGALVNATTQAERGKACAEYMRIAFTNSACVGLHWFELNDQPLSGRFDGENMNVGLVNVCNVPYQDCVREFPP